MMKIALQNTILCANNCNVKQTSCNRRGRCEELAGGYQCFCSHGFHGNNCENEKCQALSCNMRGRCAELTGGFRCFCDRGFYGNKCENVRSCPVVTKPDHGAVTCGGLNGKSYFQSVCTFTCDRGFILNGSISATCQSSGSWTPDNPICQAITCALLEKPEHSNVNCSGPHGEKHYNTSCYFSCDDGYTLEGNHKTICMESGSWNSHGGQCTVNQLKLILIIVPVGSIAAALLILLTVICWYNRRKHQAQSTSDDLPMQQKTLAYENQGIYVLPTPYLNNDIPQDEMYVNNLSTDQEIYKNLE
ncbi:E-selectin-like [Scyliorhinus canicula]|uniref:E-selectin-like n=1 Tax=Scyliorhinus canicula TaxID=7830 RepID=UPI0018F5685E|nr:E-selectin-like [Scyliorhinus canicula]XP_038633917.1 E-selectin-like [Scyliorhinus canicula]